jgi:DNA repair exonuclease SbcCD ATPase subunit
MDSHEKYLELCAASTAGELSGEEERTLEEHLAVCASCREAKHRFEMTVQRVVPTLADDLASHTGGSDTSWSLEKAEAAFFKRLKADQNSNPPADNAPGEVEIEPIGRRLAYRPSRIPWAELWMPFAACVFLAIALGVVAYRSGEKRVADRSREITARTDVSVSSLEEQISDFGHEKAQLLSKLAEDDEAIRDLKRNVAKQDDEIRRLRQPNDAIVVQSKEADQKTPANGRVEVSSREADLVAAQTSLQELQAKVNALSQQRDESAKRAESLDVKVSELTQLARDREQALDRQQGELVKQQELLDHDRDIRELMGARDLYIAEVHDISGNGRADKTYGRVFYTKGKSLIFYAYDLDAQPGVRDASSFQAWGRRGPDKEQALNLGIFYEDNARKKRWVLKAEDPKTLSDIDAVFVTVEPSGGSHHPSGKQLLFAYLQISPNHP